MTTGPKYVLHDILTCHNFYQIARFLHSTVDFFILNIYVRHYERNRGFRPPLFQILNRYIVLEMLNALKVLLSPFLHALNFTIQLT